MKDNEILYETKPIYWAPFSCFGATTAYKQRPKDYFEKGKKNATTGIQEAIDNDPLSKIIFETLMKDGKIGKIYLNDVETNRRFAHNCKMPHFL